MHPHEVRLCGICGVIGIADRGEAESITRRIPGGTPGGQRTITTDDDAPRCRVKLSIGPCGISSSAGETAPFRVLPPSEILNSGVRVAHPKDEIGMD
jgi:hypothetical protein